MYQAASAQSNNIYEIRGTADFGIYHINATTGTVTTIFAGYPGGSSATIAQRPSDGMLFYAINVANGQVYRYNPATPGVVPAQLTNTLGGSVPSSLRMAFSPGGTLYYLPDSGVLYTIDQTTGIASPGPTITGLGSGGDMAFSSGGTLYVINSSRQLFTAPLAGGAATLLGTVTFPGGITPATLGMGFDGSGVMRVQTQNPSNMYNVSLATFAASNPIAIGGGTTSTGDLASSGAPNPNLSITKTDGLSTVYRGGPVSYTIVVTNSSAYPVTGTVTDTVPASVTGLSWTCAASAGSTCTAASGAGNAINTSAMLLVGGTATYTVSGTLSAAASGTLANTATVAVPTFLTDSNTANNTATDTDTINLNANLGITKTDGLANINPGSAVSYTIVVSNAGPDASNGSIVTDTVPATITGVTWTCGAPTGGATCGAASGSGNSINTTANLPSGGSVTYTVSGTLATTATGTLSNTATVVTPASGVTDPNDPTRTGGGNNSATDNTTINPVADVRIAKSHSGNFTVGVNGTYTLTASNPGSLATSGTITVTDNLPTGLTVAAIPTGTGWNCSTTVVGSSTATCTSSTVIAAGATSPNPITLTVVVSAAAFAASPVTNVANISGGGEPVFNNGNNSASDPTTINGVADVRIAKSHSGNFTVGVNGTYTLTASNSGTLATSGTITVIDNSPTGLTIAAIPTGTGWNCSTTVVGSSTATCTSSTVIAAGATSPNPITVTVVVAAAAFPAVTNAANISGGGEPAYNNGNNSASDPTTVNGVADVRIAKSHAGNFTVGVNGTYTLTASNSGTLATSGTITVIDNLPTGLTVASIPTGTGWNCSTTVVGSSTATCTSATVIAAGATSPNPITVTVVVAAAAFPAVTNAATISGGGEPAYNNGNNSASDPTTVNGVPDLTIVKSHVGNFTQGQVGATYSITATNSGTAATSGTVTVVDTLPSGLTAITISGTGWSCVLGTLTCTRNDALAVGASYPAITLTVNVSQTAPASVTNSVTVSGGGQNNTGNDSASDPTTINGVADVRIAKSHSGNFTVGVNGAYALTASNSGTGSTSGALTVTDNLPTGLTVASIPTGTGWNCSTTVVGSSTATCTSSTVIAGGATSPNPITLTVVVSPAAFAASPVTNVANISGGGEPAFNNGNNSASDPTTINGVADVRIAKSHSGNFTVGINGTYTLTASNPGSLATSGTITVIDNLPTGLTVAAIPTGTGWNCSTTVLGSSTATCTSSTVIAAGATSPNPITLTVVVSAAAFAASPVTNVANISGGGEPAYNNGNNSASDPTTINGAPDLTIAKTHTGNFTQGQTGATYSITATNSGTAVTSGTVTVVDTLPSGLTATAISGTGWSCVLGTLTCTRNDALAVGASYPVITLTVNVSLTAPASVTNSVTVSGGGENNASNNTANDLTTINAAAPPSISLLKSVSPSGTQNPGTDLLYTIAYTNSGGQPANNLIIADPNPANAVPAERVFRNVDFKVGSLTSSPGSTGLVATFQYSNDGGTTWTYTPVSGAGGAPTSYDRVVTNIRWSFAGSLSQTAPNNTGSVSFTVRIR
jgi:uncharacterized repeat protein (TIGR01451 family)